MLFSWLRNRRRRKLLAEPFPEDRLAVLRDQVAYYTVVTDVERAKLRDMVHIMLAEKEWKGCNGLELTDAMRVVIAGLAGVLVLGFDDFYFENVQEILVYPRPMRESHESPLVGSATVVEEFDVLGQAHHRGPVRLSWKSIIRDLQNPDRGENLVFHEFAHQLDRLNGAMDGTPNLPTSELAERWGKIMNHEFRRLQRAERKGRRTLLDPYGSDDPAEFFAVTTECFFVAPQAMREVYPDLYQLFRDYYHQDPAAWPEFEGHP